MLSKLGLIASIHDFNGPVIDGPIVRVPFTVFPYLPEHICSNHLISQIKCRENNGINFFQLRFYCLDIAFGWVYMTLLSGTNEKTLTSASGAAVLYRPVGESGVRSWSKAMTKKYTFASRVNCCVRLRIMKL